MIISSLPKIWVPIRWALTMMVKQWPQSLVLMELSLFRITCIRILTVTHYQASCNLQMANSCKECTAEETQIFMIQLNSSYLKITRQFRQFLSCLEMKNNSISSSSICNTNNFNNFSKCSNNFNRYSKKITWFSSNNMKMKKIERRLLNMSDLKSLIAWSEAIP